MNPFALHITWTCYGTWLPGDERGFVSNQLFEGNRFTPKENIPGTPYAPSNPFTEQHARNQMKDTPVYLSLHEAKIAAEELVAATRKRGWRILRAALMANHIHVVVTDCPEDGEAVRRVLKGTSQAALSNAKGKSRRWWTAGGSDRYKRDWEALENAVNYVANLKDKLVEIIDMEVILCAQG